VGTVMTGTITTPSGSGVVGFGGCSVSNIGTVFTNTIKASTANAPVSFGAGTLSNISALYVASDYYQNGSVLGTVALSNSAPTLTATDMIIVSTTPLTSYNGNYVTRKFGNEVYMQIAAMYYMSAMDGLYSSTDDAYITLQYPLASWYPTGFMFGNLYMTVTSGSVVTNYPAYLKKTASGVAVRFLNLTTESPIGTFTQATTFTLHGNVSYITT